MRVAQQTAGRNAAWARSDVVVDRAGRLATFEAGRPDGLPVVLLHGVGHWTQAAWSPLMRALADDYRLLAFDLPGFGDSDKPDAVYDLAFFTNALRSFVAERGLRRFALVGNSLGGLIAAQFAGESPDGVAALGLIAPAGFLPTAGLLWLAYGLAPLIEFFPLTTPRWLVRRTVDLAMYDPASVSEETHERAYLLAQDPLVRRAFGRVYGAARATLFARDALRAGFARYGGPVLVCWGRHDNFLPIAGLRVARSTYPRAHVTVVEHGGHLPQVEEPATVADALRAIYPPGGPEGTRESRVGG